MKASDANAMLQFYPRWVTRHVKNDVNSIGIISPSAEELYILDVAFPWAGITQLSKDTCDLDKPLTQKFDLMMFSNVFMYSKDPALWFSNIFPKTKYILIQDLILGQRMKDRELGDDGDSSRFCYPPNYMSRIPGYDLSKHDDRLLDFYVYSDPNAPGPENQSFLIMLKGDL